MIAAAATSVRTTGSTLCTTSSSQVRNSFTASSLEARPPSSLGSVAVLLDPAPWHPWRDPADVFLAVSTSHAHVFWLDAGPDAALGWSWIGWGSPADPGTVRAAAATGGSTPVGESRFRGGWVGWTGYDEAARRAGAPAAAPDDDVPPSLWIEVEGLIAFDHGSRRMQYLGEAVAGSDIAPAAQRLAAAPPVGPAHARHAPAQYASLIEECRASIREGDAYQLCLTTRFWVEHEIDPLAAFLSLRGATPAHHAGIIMSGGVALLSASPERFLEVSGAAVRTHPIKGTRPRGTDPAADSALAVALHDSPKERAENVMIVDLMRNDLARACLPATVTVERLLDVESYPAVHQLVSTVAGTLRDGTTVGELLDAAFPAGSMTGAPKLSAMTILHRLEAAPRGVFAGCFGWVGAAGGLDLAMVIRSIVVHPGGAYVGAGGGITWGSVAADEVAEVGVKARAPLAAIGADLPAGW
ncbi:MAG: anthranilate synthase component I family protein [Microbacterium sp.]|nr:anthranilate synthase component I family protein [Microbacterium sp.]